SEEPPGYPLSTRCFAPGTPEETIEAFHAVEAAAAAREPDPDAPQAALQLQGRWSATATHPTDSATQGLPTTLTWSIVPDGTPVPSGSGIGDSNDPSNLRAFLSSVYGSGLDGGGNPLWLSYFRTVFDNISAQTGITYLYEPNDDGVTKNSSNNGILGVRGDIRICGHEIDGNSSVLAYNSYPGQGGDMVIDTDDNWFNNNKLNANSLTNLVEHENGHGLGLKHVCPTNQTKLLEPIIYLGYRGIQFDDLYGLQRQYGDFLEKHNGSRNNDSFANAAPLNLTPGTPFALQWLSIDDDTDTDYYSIEAIPGTTITVRVIPSSASYLEGAANTNGSCSSGSTFDSSTRQNLTLALLAPDQLTTIANGSNTPAGQTEEIINVPTTHNGTHYIRVDESDAGLDTCQLYRLEVTVNYPNIALDLSASTLEEESFPARNGVPDPGETVRYDLTLASIGSLSANNIQATLTGPAGFTSFTPTQSYGSLSTGQETKHSFIFALEGACGDPLNLTLNITADSGYNQSFPLDLTLGLPAPLAADADSSPDLHPGWTGTSTGSGSNWGTNSSTYVSSPRSFFASNPNAAGSSTLQSTSFQNGPHPSALSFTHLYNTESGYDGGLLEISVNNGPWLDFLASGGSFTANGYNDTLASSGGNLNPLKGRSAWSGNSAVFLTTTALLPANAANLPVRLRWIIGHDASVAGTGWYLDNILLGAPSCDSGPPTLFLATTDTTADEFVPLDTASITLSTPLPNLLPIPATLQNSGTADLALDVSGLSGLELPAGQASLTATVTATPDTLPEGLETLNLTLAGGSGSALLTIADAPYQQWAFSFLGSGPLTGPFDDFDGDGLTNIEEYSHQSLPNSPSL
ncbi:MAG: matrixin family metalloprotease, partial [Verrucomicrobia bacterium]|nr:matrixin family metalloprotease [Verrucomicrobiota bacterium]